MGAGSGGVVENGEGELGEREEEEEEGSLSSSATSGREAMHGGRRHATLSGWRGEMHWRRKVAEGRRGDDVGVNTPVISVKCTWAQLPKRYYCSYALPCTGG